MEKPTSSTGFNPHVSRQRAVPPALVLCRGSPRSPLGRPSRRGAPGAVHGLPEGCRRVGRGAGFTAGEGQPDGWSALAKGEVGVGDARDMKRAPEGAPNAW